MISQTITFLRKVMMGFLDGFRKDSRTAIYKIVQKKIENQQKASIFQRKRGVKSGF